MRSGPPLDEVIRGRTSLRVLRTLSLYPEKEFTGRELAGMSGGSPSKIIAELERFKALGMVTRKTHGRTHIWRANRQHEVLRILSTLFVKEDALRHEVERELAQGVNDERIARAILFGSYARDDAGSASDVDLLVLVKHAGDVELVRDILDALSVRLRTRFGLRLSPILHPESDSRRLQRTPLGTQIAKEGRAIRGEPL